jgi:hypothetical protein
MSSSHLERRFESYWMAQFPNVTQPVREYLFHSEKNWRFDFAWLNHMVALEIQGGTYTRGRHARGASMRKDYEKMNAAAGMGWRIFYADTTMLNPKTLPMIAAQIASVVHSPILMGDLERSRWIAILRNLDPHGCFEWHGIQVNRLNTSNYCVTKGGSTVTFKRGKKPLSSVRDEVLIHILGGR